MTITQTDTCGRMIAALDEHETRSLRPCVKAPGHAGHCHYRAARPATDPVPHTPVAVEHLFWVDHMLTASSLNVEMRALCGAWESPDEGDIGENTVTVVGNLVPLFERDDCARCAEMLSADYVRGATQGSTS